MLLEQPSPTVTIQKQTGGGPRVGTRHEQQLWLRFRFGWLVTGTVTQKLEFNIPVSGAVAQRLSFRFPVSAQVAKAIMFRYPVYGSMNLKFQLPIRGQVGKNTEDLEREISDLKYIVSKKRKRRGEQE